MDVFVYGKGRVFWVYIVVGGNIRGREMGFKMRVDLMWKEEIGEKMKI